MEELKLGKKSSDLKLLCEFLGVPSRSEYDKDLEKAVKSFQMSKGLTVDGWVGYNTWKNLILDYRSKTIKSGDITEWDYKIFGNLLGVEPECLMAVQKVETNGVGGFISPGKPRILFEGHVFWKELSNIGISPEKYGNAWADVLYRTWDRTKYKGGLGEWTRLEKAKKISSGAAEKSCSWGMYQIMGNNYLKCGCKSIEEFVNLMCKDTFSQFLLGLEFLKNTRILKYLVNKDWERFARLYNGSSYKLNKYDTKLMTAYNTYKNTKI